MTRRRVALVSLCLGVVGLVLAFRGPTGGGAGAARVHPELPVTAMDRGIGIANNSPRLEVDPTESRFVVMANRLDAPDFGCALQLSGDGGRTWLPTDPVPALPPGADKCYAPEVVFDRTGRLYYLFVGLAGGGNEPTGAFLTSSADRGRTFSPPRQVLGPLKFGVRMALDRAFRAAGRLHIVWIEARSDPPLGGFGVGPNPIMASFSDDGGASFSTPSQVSDVSRERVVAPGLALGSGGRVHVAYYDLGDDAIDYQGLEGPRWDGRWSLIVASSSDGGERFGPGRVVDDGIVPARRVMLIFTMPPAAVAAEGSRLCLAWSDARRGDEDVMLRCTAEGTKWGPLTRINDDRPGTGRSQYLPQISVSGRQVDAIFFDRRADPENLRTEVMYAASGDGGRHFGPNVVVTEDASNGRIGQSYSVPSAEGLVEFGSRLGLLRSSYTVLAAWPDTRNGTAPGTGQDLFATHITVDAPKSRRSSSWLGIALLLAGSVAGGATARWSRGLPWRTGRGQD